MGPETYKDKIKNLVYVWTLPIYLWSIGASSLEEYLGRVELDFMESNGLAFGPDNRLNFKTLIKPTVITSFPGQAVDRHLKITGHLPELGCCELDQPK